MALLTPYARGGLWDGFFDRPRALLSTEIPPGAWWNFDLSGLREENKAIVHAVLAWFLYQVVTVGAQPLDVYIDEGWRLLRGGAFTDLLDELGRRARKRGVGVTLSTHLPGDLVRRSTSLGLASTAFIGRLGPEEAYGFFRSLGAAEGEARSRAEQVARLPPRVFLAAPAGGRGAAFPVQVTIPAPGWRSGSSWERRGEGCDRKRADMKGALACPRCGYNIAYSHNPILSQCPYCTHKWEKWELLFSALPLPDIREQIAAWLGQLPAPAVFEIAATENGLRVYLQVAPGVGEGVARSWAALTRQQSRWRKVPLEDREPGASLCSANLRHPAPAGRGGGGSAPGPRRPAARVGAQERQGGRTGIQRPRRRQYPCGSGYWGGKRRCRSGCAPWPPTTTAPNPGSRLTPPIPGGCAWRCGALVWVWAA